MKKTPRFLLPLFVALSLLVAPAVAMAQSGPVHQLLAGGVYDPAATNLRIVPPKGGMVLVYRDGKAVGWLMRSGYLTVKPNRVYGVMATRGTSVLFNAGLMVRPGLTELIWKKGDPQPQMSFLPSYYPYSSRVGGHYGGHHAAPPPAKRKSSSSAQATRSHSVVKTEVGTVHRGAVATPASASGQQPALHQAKPQARVALLVAKRAHRVALAKAR